MTEERFNEIINQIYFNYNSVGPGPAKEILEYIKELEKKIRLNSGVHKKESLVDFGQKVIEASQDNPSWSLEELADDFIKNSEK